MNFLLGEISLFLLCIKLRSVQKLHEASIMVNLSLQTVIPAQQKAWLLPSRLQSITVVQGETQKFCYLYQNPGGPSAAKIVYSDSSQRRISYNAMNMVFILSIKVSIGTLILVLNVSNGHKTTFFPWNRYLMVESFQKTLLKMYCFRYSKQFCRNWRIQFFQHYLIQYFFKFYWSSRREIVRAVEKSANFIDCLRSSKSYYS